MHATRTFKFSPVIRVVLALLVSFALITACASNPGDSRAKQGAKTGAAVGAGIGLLLGVLSGNSDLAARAVVVGAASGAASGGYEGWRQDQHDERTRQITQAIRESDTSSQQANLDAEARQREQLTRFLGVWQMTGWVQEPGESRINVTSQVNGNVHMSYFVELSYIDFHAEGIDGTIWGTTTFGYDTDTGYTISTRFNTLPDAIEASGGTFASASRSFTFAGTDYHTIVNFETPDRFTVSTTTRANGRDYTVESYQLTRS